ncbi:hypothetical protein N8772_04330 [Rickettsiales bacterium]|nr:hypothetical protein [Rickettsiales bacterium]MDB2550426.1 hypothetical protein [Rickettsiales bacterium]
MTNKKISLYTNKEEKELKELMNQFDNKIIDSDYFGQKSMEYFILCEGRKNRIRFNNLTEDDIKNGFTPCNFPYLMDSAFYSEEECQRFWKVNKKNKS